MDRANDAESIIKKTVYIGATDDADVPDKQPAALPSSKALSNDDVQQRLVAKVRRWAQEAAPPQAALPGMEAAPTASTDALVSQVVRNVTERLIELTIDVPQIVVLPTREVNHRFQDFALEGLEKINFQPVS